jgi:hypothetical protein
MLPIVLLMLAQEIGPPGDEPEPPRTTLTRPRHCSRRSDEIVVCGGGQESQRILDLPEPGTRPFFRPATAQVSRNKRVTARAESGPIATAPAPRAMIDFTLSF